MSPDHSPLIWAISAIAVAGVIVRPFGGPEWVFATAGALVLLVFGLIAPAAALAGVASGVDVYLFLAGMMLLAEVARREGLFDYLAAHAARSARGSPKRLFTLVYLVGVLVTVFLSNDATAVVLTPAVAAVARAAGAATPMPYLLICAFVANAASFALPISNPANLVVFGDAMPPLAEWLWRFAPASVLSIVMTYLMLRWTQRAHLAGKTRTDIAIPKLGRGGRIAAVGLVGAVLVLLGASAAGLALGLPTLLAGVGTVIAVLVAERSSPWPVLRHVSWDTLVLVAALFVIVQGLEATSLTATLVGALEQASEAAPGMTAAATGALLAFATNLTNNLPLGLVSASVVGAAQVPEKILDAVLVGIDLGPNLSVTGSLATILWLTALRREAIKFGSIRFLAVGIVVMPPALILSLAAISFF
jgi:arsenical pump membrane protein